MLQKPLAAEMTPALPLLATREMHYQVGREERWHAHELAQLVLCLQGVMREQTDTTFTQWRQQLRLSEALAHGARADGCAHRQPTWLPKPQRLYLDVPPFDG